MGGGGGGTVDSTLPIGRAWPTFAYYISICVNHHFVIMIGVAALRGLFRQQVPLEAAIPGLRWFAAAPNQMALIKQLRDQTGAPISDVKSALQQADWDLGATCMRAHILNKITLSPEFKLAATAL